MHGEKQVPTTPTSARRLDLYRVNLELISVCRPLCAKMRRFNRRLGAQLTESLASTLQNLVKAMRRTGKDRAHPLRHPMNWTPPRVPVNLDPKRATPASRFTCCVEVQIFEDTCS